MLKLEQISNARLIHWSFLKKESDVITTETQVPAMSTSGIELTRCHTLSLDAAVTTCAFPSAVRGDNSEQSPLTIFAARTNENILQFVFLILKFVI